MGVKNFYKRNGRFRKKSLRRKPKRRRLNQNEFRRQRFLLDQLRFGVKIHFPSGMFRKEFEPQEAKILTSAARRRFSKEMHATYRYAEVKFNPAFFEISAHIPST